MKLITNRHRNIALLAKQGSTYLHLVVVTAHGLEATRITEDELTADWSEVTSYDPDWALERFTAIARDIGATAGAAKLLGIEPHTIH